VRQQKLLVYTFGTPQKVEQAVPTGPAQPLFRFARSPPTPCLCPSLTQSNRRGTRPVCPVAWEGWHREVSPYPDQRRILPVPARSGGDRLTERIPAVQPRRRERGKVPQRRPLPDPRGAIWRAG
jgi:hypothetical protein